MCTQSRTRQLGVVYDFQVVSPIVTARMEGMEVFDGLSLNLHQGFVSHLSSGIGAGLPPHDLRMYWEAASQNT